MSESSHKSNMLPQDDMKHMMPTATTDTTPNAFEHEENQQALSGGKPKKTAGEQIYNRFTYQGIDWVANSAFAIGFAYLTERNPTGYKYLGKRINDSCKLVLKPFYKQGKALDNAADLGQTFVSIMAGGTAIIPPIMYLEKNKAEFVQKLDERIYGEEEVANNPRFQAAYEAINNEPKKGFWTGMGARMIVLAPMLHGHINHQEFMDRNLYSYVHKNTKRLADFAGIEGKAFKGKVPEHMNLTQNAAGKFINADGKEVMDNWDRLHYIMGFDISLTAIYSVAHEIAYKGLAAVFDRNKEPANANGAPSRTPSPEYRRSAAEHLVAIDRTKSFERDETADHEETAPQHTVAEVTAHERVRSIPSQQIGGQT